MQEKENILDILVRTRKALSESDALTIKKLSNRTVHSSSIYQDADNIALAVILYSLSKIMEREKYSQYREYPFFIAAVRKNLDFAINALKQDKLEDFTNALISIRNSINELSGHLKQYIQEVFRRASINKASRIYEHGISMQQTAHLLGITLFELAEYAGKTGIADVNLSITQDIMERIKTAEEIFK